jgi:very-short-patch-repair endonuclease
VHREGAKGSDLGPEAVVRKVVQQGWRGEWAVARVAERQLGLVTRGQLAALGVGRGAVARRIESGRLHRVHRGVYRVGHPSPLPFSRELAAVLALGEGATLSHSSAAYAWALAPEPRGVVEITIPPDRRRTRAGIRAHRSMLPSNDVTTCRGIPTTTPARTLVDLAAMSSSVELERAVADALRRRLVTRRDLKEAFVGSRPGAAALRALLARAEGPALTRSEAEARMLALVRAARLPPPEHNVRVGRYELDLLWRDERLVVEVDGYAFHRGRASFERDRARDAQLTAAGLRVMRITWRQLVDEPEAVIARLAQGLATPGSGACR